MTDESRPSRRPISLYCKPSARPREISSRSANINIARTAGILSHRVVKIKCYDRLSPRGAHNDTLREAPVNGDYDGRQYVGVDLHRRRSVIVRMTPDGEHLGWVRIDN